nr:reverse transcriptase domain-containing protein [Tanacetum cinerariifolium]
MAAEGNGDLPVPDLRTIEELCQPSLNGRGDPISPIAIQATNFGLKNDMIQQVQNSCQFHVLPGDDANKHLDKFLHVTQSIKENGVTDDALRLYLFPHSLTHHATAWFDRLLRNSINTFEQMAKMFLAWERYKLSIDRFPNHNMLPVTQIDILYNDLTLRHRDAINAAAEGTFMKRRPEECYDLIENMTAYHNDWDTSAQRSESSSSITSYSDTEIAALKAEMAEINKHIMRVLQVNQQVKVVTLSCETCGGPHSFNDCRATVGNTQNVYAAGVYQGNSYQPQGKRNLLRYHSDNYLGPPGFNQNQNRNNQNQNFHNQNRNQGNHNHQRNNQGRNKFFQGANQGENQPSAYQAPTYQAPVYQAPVHQPQIPRLQVVTTNEFTNFIKANDFMKMNTASSLGSRTLPGNTITNPKEDLKSITTRSGIAYQGPTFPTTSSFFLPVVECEIEATKDMVHPTNNGSTEDVQPLVVQTKSLILNSKPVISPIIVPVASPDKLCELARTPLNEHCSEVLLNKLPKKLRDPDKFLIPCDFPGMAECLALADLSASFNLMPLSVWNKLSLPDLSPTCMTLELTDHLISRPVRVTKDVFVKVGTFHFSADFVVVDFDADPRVPLIIERYFLKTGRAFIDVFEGELTLRVGKEAVTFNLDQTSRYSANYNEMMANRIDVIDMACEEYSQEVLGFSDMIASGNPTPYYNPIVSTTSSTLTPLRNSDFLLEEFDAFLALVDDPTSPEVDQSYVDTEGDILLLEAFLNDDPSVPLPNEGNYLPQGQKELKIYKAKSDKSSIDEPPEVEIKDLPSHLEYAFLEGDNKLPVIIAKYLSKEEKTALITEDFKPAVQHQRRVNPKIYDVIKNEVLKLLDAGLIYPIFDSPWEKTTFTCPYRTFAYRRMPFGLCNAPGTFKRCMMAIFHEMIEKTIEVFMDDFLVFRNSFQTCLSHLEKMLKRCEDTNLFLNWEKSHFMVKEGIVLGHKISENRIEVDKAKVDVIAKLRHPTTVKASILIAPDWDMPFELMCDASDFAIGAVLGQRQEKHFRPIRYSSKTMTEAESNYTTTEKEMLAVVYAFEKFWSYLIMNKSIVYTDHSALKYLFAKKDSKARLLQNPHQNVLDPKEINESFPLETLNMVSTRGNSSTSWFADLSSEGVYTTRKPLTFSRLATMDPPGDIMTQITQPRRCLIQDSIGLPFTVMPKSYSKRVTFVNVKERFRKEMRYHKIPSKFVKLLTSEVLTSWARSRLQEGINTYL